MRTFKTGNFEITFEHDIQDSAIIAPYATIRNLLTGEEGGVLELDIICQTEPQADEEVIREAKHRIATGQWRD